MYGPKTVEEGNKEYERYPIRSGTEGGAGVWSFLSAEEEEESESKAREMSFITTTRREPEKRKNLF